MLIKSHALAWLFGKRKLSETNIFLRIVEGSTIEIDGESSRAKLKRIIRLCDDAAAEDIQHGDLFVPKVEDFFHFTLDPIRIIGEGDIIRPKMHLDVVFEDLLFLQRQEVEPQILIRGDDMLMDA